MLKGAQSSLLAGSTGNDKDWISVATPSMSHGMVETSQTCATTAPPA